jgi:hypothetical protein
VPSECRLSYPHPSHTVLGPNPFMCPGIPYPDATSSNIPVYSCGQGATHDKHTYENDGTKWLCLGIHEHPELDDSIIKARLHVKLCNLGYGHKAHRSTFEGQNVMCPGREHTIETTPEFDEGKMNTTRDAAADFMTECGLDPTPDAIGQLAEVFLPCLKIMCERGYDPDGLTWKAEGWRGMVWKARDKMTRLWFHAWGNGNDHPDSAVDCINYLGFYIRLRNGIGSEWGDRGAPGGVSEDLH